MAFRASRNIEQSIMEWIRDNLEDDSWSGVTVVKTWAEVYDEDNEIDPPIICVRLSDTVWLDGEIGSTIAERQPLILIEIFATSDGNREDLKDYLISILKDGFPYNEYSIVNRTITKIQQNGYLTITSRITDKVEDLNIPKSNLAVKDRYKHLISFIVSRGILE